MSAWSVAAAFAATAFYMLPESAGADPQALLWVECNRVEIRNPPEADYHLGHQQALAHPDDQGSAAGNHPGIIPVLFQK